MMRRLGGHWFVIPPVFGAALSSTLERIVPQNRSKVKQQSAKLWCRVATGGGAVRDKLRWGICVGGVGIFVVIWMLCGIMVM